LEEHIASIFRVEENFSKNQHVSRWQAACWFLLKFSSTLKMEAISSSETSVASQQTTRRYIPEDYTLHNHRCENLKSYLKYLIYAYISISAILKLANNPCPV
jgi:hypothetical protein